MPLPTINIPQIGNLQKPLKNQTAGLSHFYDCRTVDTKVGLISEDNKLIEYKGFFDGINFQCQSQGKMNLLFSLIIPGLLLAAAGSVGGQPQQVSSAHGSRTPDCSPPCPDGGSVRGAGIIIIVGGTIFISNNNNNFEL